MLQYDAYNSWHLQNPGNTIAIHEIKKYYGIAFSRAKVLNQLSLIVCLLLNNSEEIAFGINYQHAIAIYNCYI